MFKHITPQHSIGSASYDISDLFIIPKEQLRNNSQWLLAFAEVLPD